MKQTVRIFILCQIAALSLCLLSACGSSGKSGGTAQAGTGTAQAGNQASAQASAEVPAASGVKRTDAPPAIPDPARILDQASVREEQNVELEFTDGTYVFNRYTYDFAAPASLTDRSDFLAYQMLLQADGLTLEQLLTDGTYSEYAVLWGEYLLGYLAADYGHWELYVPDSVGINRTSNGESSGGFQNDAFVQGGIDGGFQNESFQITVEPGEAGGSGTSDGRTVTTCEACHGSGRCDGCGGDGLFDNPYLGNNVERCTICGGTGICGVCEGTGVWVFE